MKEKFHQQSVDSVSVIQSSLQSATLGLIIHAFLPEDVLDVSVFIQQIFLLVKANSC